MLEEFPIASVHGRFQIIHLEHLEYFQRAVDRYGKIYIGLTGQRRDLDGDDSRSSMMMNPLTYWERVEMWRRLLAELGYRLEDYPIGPFPIEVPDHLSDFVPTSCICATTIRESWNWEKVRRLEERGYKVEVLKQDLDKGLSATMVRSLIAEGSPEWTRLVPGSVADFLRSIDIRSRLLAGSG